jgi:hypothetical protein
MDGMYLDASNHLIKNVKICLCVHSFVTTDELAMQYQGVGVWYFFEKSIFQ